MEFFSIFFGLFGWVSMAIILVVLLAMGVVVSLDNIFMYLFIFFFTLVLVNTAWYWFCCGMSRWLKKGTQIQNWFENQFLDMRYPSRVRRRRNKLLNQSGS